MNKAVLYLAASLVVFGSAGVASIIVPAKSAASPARPAAAAPAPLATRALLTKRIDENFKSVDTNGDGMLSEAEIAAAQSKGLQSRVAVARQRLDTEFGKLDTNHDGQLSKVEFMAAAPKLPAGSPNGSAILGRLDKNNDGKITLDEFRAPLLARFDAADTNHDGTISASERQALQARARNHR